MYILFLYRIKIIIEIKIDAVVTEYYIMSQVNVFVEITSKDFIEITSKKDKFLKERKKGKNRKANFQKN